MCVLYAIIQYRDDSSSSYNILLPCPFHIHVMTVGAMLQLKEGAVKKGYLKYKWRAFDLTLYSGKNYTVALVAAHRAASLETECNNMSSRE